MSLEMLTDHSGFGDADAGHVDSAAANGDAGFAAAGTVSASGEPFRHQGRFPPVSLFAVQAWPQNGDQLPAMPLRQLHGALQGTPEPAIPASVYSGIA